MHYPDRHSTSSFRHRPSALLWWGLGVLVLGSGPLMLFIISDAIGITERSNPIGPGILCALTFWPGVGLTVAGAIVTLKRRRASS